MMKICLIWLTLLTLWTLVKWRENVGIWKAHLKEHTEKNMEG